MGAAMEPRVTFIIAHHNYQEYLGGAVDSALSQTYNNIHVCVVDDCSEDQNAVKEILEEKAGGFDSIEVDSEIKYVSEKITYVQLISHSGKSYKQAYARNRGMEACWDDTDYFAILDADDENYPTKIEKCVAALEKNPRAGAAYTDTNIINVANGRIVHEYREPFDNFRLIQECIVHSGCILRKTALAQVLENGVVFDEEMPPCEDYDLWIRIAEKFLIVHVPEPLVLVRVHPQNSTNTSTHNHRVSRIQRIHEKRLARHGK
jgi:glycosyltransferase involved in cell wall biosynthesis